PAPARTVPRLFARKERLVCDCDTDFGPMASVMVGAMLASGVETVWSGVEIPEYGDGITRKDYRGKGIVLERFAEMARFNYGSTVIVLLPPGAPSLARVRPAGSPVGPGAARFAEMARFNCGSTVIVLLPPGAATLAPGLQAESPVRLGQALAHLAH